MQDIAMTCARKPRSQILPFCGMHARDQQATSAALLIDGAKDGVHSIGGREREREIEREQYSVDGEVHEKK
eukprot:5368563-Alexandrium_andersonii.AAC.1